MNRIVAIIPARGGSKRIEKKNIIDFHGKPMIAWSIEAALKTNLFAHVVVSTDDPEIAEVARHYGAYVPFIRKNYADDHSPVSLATLETLRQLRDDAGEEYETVVQLMANCPLRNEKHIISAIEYFHANEASSQISCFKFGWMNPWWAATLINGLHPKGLFPKAGKMRSQDLPPLYCPTGATWIAKTSVLRKNKTFHVNNKIFCEMSWESAIDIDDLNDLKMAKLLFLMREDK